MTAGGKISRRGLLLGGVATAAVASNLGQQSASAAGRVGARLVGPFVNADAFGLVPNLTTDQTATLQAAIDQAAARGLTLQLMPGGYVVGNVVLRPGTRIVGAGPGTVLSYAGTGAMLSARRADNVALAALTLDGALLPFDVRRARGLVQVEDCRRVAITDVAVLRSAGDGIALVRSAGHLERASVSSCADAGIFSLDADASAGAVEISQTRVVDCRDNGILIWRSAPGADGSRVVDVTVARIGNKSGGTGQYGNGVNVFRAGGVRVAQCGISECAYSAVRGNGANNIQMLGNQVSAIGEVALYAEFGFEGAVIANNIVDGAATGIAVTNFNEGGRLAVVQGNLVRNLVRREAEPVDKRGEGIAVEADAAVTGNVIESAASAGLLIGWGRHMRDVVASGNVVRGAEIGIAVSAAQGAGRCVLANNLISGARNGAIRAMDHARTVSGDLIAERAFQHVVLAGNAVA